MTAPACRAAAAARPGARWRLRHLGRAPHRLGFFLGLLVLACASLWWAWVQAARAGLGAAPPQAVAPTLVHGAALSLGSMPLFFAGFWFTALPRWLRVPPWPVATLAPALLLQAAGALAWLAGGLASAPLALGGSVLATVGLAWTAALLLRLVRRSRAADQVHARALLAACSWGCGCQALLAAGLAAGRADAAHAGVQAGLWGFVAPVFVIAGHRLIAVFSADGPPWAGRAGPWALPALLLAALAGEAAAALLPLAGAQAGHGVPWGLAALQALAGGVALGHAAAWWRLHRPRSRLLAMFYAGFVWLGLALLLQAGAHAWQGARGAAPPWQWAGVHALALGSLGTLLLAMVTRVSCGLGGRALVADGWLWALFLGLQAAVGLRLVAALPLAGAPAWRLAAALAWCGVVLAWAVRLGGWYGRVRPDGRPG